MPVKQSDQIYLELNSIVIQLLQQLPQKQLSHSQITFVMFKLKHTRNASLVLPA